MMYGQMRRVYCRSVDRLVSASAADPVVRNAILRVHRALELCLLRPRVSPQRLMDLASSEQLDVLSGGLGDAHAAPAGCKSRWQAAWPATVAAVAYAFLGGADRLSVEAVCRTWRGHSLASGDAVSANAVRQLDADKYAASRYVATFTARCQVVEDAECTSDGPRVGAAG
jgi:hypothetical protein